MIKAEQVVKKYGDFTAVNNLNLHIKKGEIYCMLGSNGAGKSTTINMFLGFIKPTSGNVYINGIDVAKEKEKIKSLIAYIPEIVNLYPNLTGLENLTFFSNLSKLNYSKLELIDFMIKSGLSENLINNRVEGYSKGMRQKVGIAIALAKNTKVLFLDEPTSGLDPQASNEFSNIISELSNNGVSILMATHDLFRAKETSHKIGIMHKGNLTAEVDTKDIDYPELEKLYLNKVKSLII
ncbi:MAG: ABC transporter ATP-binding protein [Tenacibaculum sp.]|nr:ABC transporter ATP-binding protein [Tenacibaculum sp.]